MKLKEKLIKRIKIKINVNAVIEKYLGINKNQMKQIAKQLN